MALETVKLEGVSVMAAGGPYRGKGSPPEGDFFDVAKLQQIADSSNALHDAGELRPVNKIGHDPEQRLLRDSGISDGERPAAGWLRNFRVEGNKLKADIENVPRKLADLIKAGAYRTRSAELRTLESQSGGKTNGPAVTGLAWLGAVGPAIRNLDDIYAYYADTPLDDDVIVVDYSEEPVPWDPDRGFRWVQAQIQEQLKADGDTFYVADVGPDRALVVEYHSEPGRTGYRVLHPGGGMRGLRAKFGRGKGRSGGPPDPNIAKIDAEIEQAKKEMNALNGQNLQEGVWQNKRYKLQKKLAELRKAKADLTDGTTSDNSSDAPASAPDLASKDISEISDVIARDWKNPNFAAKPYLQAMRQLGSVDDQYGADSGRSVVQYFLSNSASWKGDTARSVKAELKKRIKNAKRSFEEVAWIVEFEIDGDELTLADRDHWILAEKAWTGDTENFIAETERVHGPVADTIGVSEVTFTEEQVQMFAEVLGIDEDDFSAETLGEALSRRNYDADALSELEQNARLGKEASVKLYEMEREHVITAALSDGKFQPADKDEWVRRYDEAPDLVKEIIATLPEDKESVKEFGTDEDGNASDELSEREFEMFANYLNIPENERYGSKEAAA